MALGAHTGNVLAMVMRQGFGLAAIGMAVGGALAAAAGFALSGLLYGVTPMDPMAWLCRDAHDAGRRGRRQLRARPSGDAGGRVDGAQDGAT